MVNEKTVINYLKKREANELTGNTVAFVELCWDAYGDNNYSGEDEKQMINLVAKLEFQSIISRVKPKASYTRALYYLTYKGMQLANK